MVSIPWWGIVLFIMLMVVLVVSLIASATATRLNRMHVRTDLARASLEAALGRRAAIVRVAFPELGPDLAQAEAIPITASEPYARADAENTLSRRISELQGGRELDKAVAIELYDVHTRVELARRFYNDAVTDTQALRRLPLVKMLRLAGTAPQPEYFDMSDSVVPRGEE